MNIHCSEAPMRPTPNKSVFSHTIEIYARLHNGNGSLVQIGSEACVGELVAAVKQTDLSLPGKFTLIKSGKTLKDEQLTLKEAGVGKGSIVHIVQEEGLSPQRLKVDVSIYYQGEKLVVRANKQDTIKELKEKLYRLVRVHPRQQWLVFRGQKLEESETLKSYEIRTDSLLCLHIAPGIKAQSSLDSEELPETSDAITRTESVKQLSGPARPIPSSKYLLYRRSQNYMTPPEGYEVEIKEPNEDDASVASGMELKFPFLREIPVRQSNVYQSKSRFDSLSSGYEPMMI